MKKMTAILLAVFMLTVASYIGLPHFIGNGSGVSEVSAQRGTLKPGSSVGFKLGSWQSNKGLMVKNITKRGTGSPGQPVIPDTIIYEEKPTIHTLVLAIIEADLSTRNPNVAWTKSVVDATANDYYNLAEALYLVGEQRDRRPRTR